MLSISDWIAFLTSEKNPNIGNLIGFMALIFAVFALATRIPVETALDAINFVLISATVIIASLAIRRYYGGRADKAGKLLNAIVSRDECIMSGDKIDPSKIEEQWKLLLEEKQKRHRCLLKGRQKSK
jgi:hypothetical protein